MFVTALTSENGVSYLTSNKHLFKSLVEKLLDTDLVLARRLILTLFSKKNQLTMWLAVTVVSNTSQRHVDDLEDFKDICFVALLSLIECSTTLVSKDDVAMVLRKLNDVLSKARVEESTLRLASCLGFCGGKIAKELISCQNKISNRVSDSTKKAIDTLCSSVMMPLRINSAIATTTATTTNDLSQEEFIKVNKWMIKNMTKRNQYLQNTRDFNRYVESDSCVRLNRILISLFLRRLDLVPLSRVAASMLNDLQAPPKELVSVWKSAFQFRKTLYRRIRESRDGELQGLSRKLRSQRLSELLEKSSRRVQDVVAYCLSLYSEALTDDSLRREKIIRQNLSGEETKIASNAEHASILASIRSFLLSFLSETKAPPDLNIIKAVVDDQSERCRLRTIGLELVSSFLSEGSSRTTQACSEGILWSLQHVLTALSEQDEKEYQRRLESLKAQNIRDQSRRIDLLRHRGILFGITAGGERVRVVRAWSSLQLRMAKLIQKASERTAERTLDLDAKQSEDMPPPPPRHDIAPLLRGTISAIRCCGVLKLSDATSVQALQHSNIVESLRECIRSVVPHRDLEIRALSREIRSTAFATLRLLLLQLGAIGVNLPKGVLEFAMKEVRFRTAELLRLTPSSPKYQEKESLCFELLRLLYPVAAISGIRVATTAEDNRALSKLFSHPHSSSRIRRRVSEFWYSTRSVSDAHFKSKLSTLFQTVERYVSFEDDEWFQIRVSDREQASKKSEAKQEEKKWQWLDENAVWCDYDARTFNLLERSAEALSNYVQTHMKNMPKTPRTMVEWGVSSVRRSSVLL